MAEQAASLLVVDDTVENLHLLSAMLTGHGYEVRPVTSGRQALAAAKSRAPDLVLLDVTMPELNGFEVCAQLKAMEAMRDVPVVFLTALNDAADKVKAFAAGGVDYVTKPFQVEEVLARVRVHLALRASRVELERSYERLRALERLREDLVQMVVHDLRAPLGALMMLLEFAREGASALDEQLREDLADAARAANAVNRMANDLLDVSRLEENKLPLERTPNDLTELCRDAARALAALDRSRSVDVEAAGPVLVGCDRHVVQRVLENLVGNAFKHTPQGGRILVSVSAASGRARVAVHDEGPGVAPELRPTLFQKFGAVAARAAGHYHSVGLGLAFCKLAVEAHGGAIGIESREPRGSTFWFELPAGAA